jgi:PleD family two-component response regulator
MDATKVAEDVRRAVYDREWPSDLAIQTRPTVSVGVGTYEGAVSVDAKYLYTVVDALAEVAKNGGRNKVHAGTVPAPK